MIAKISKAIRYGSRVYNVLANRLRIYSYQLLYPSLVITPDSFVGRRTNIRAITKSHIYINHSSVAQGSVIIADHGGKILISEALIGINCIIVARESIQIHPNCQIAEMVVIRDQNHNFEAPGKTIVEQGFSTAPIVIEENVWLGAKVTVLAGSHIGKNTVVGANSVVRGILEPNSVYVGAPARKVKSF